MLNLRDYQQEGVNQIYDAYKRNIKRVLYCAATGSGKSILFTYLAKEALSFKMNVVLVVKRRQLIFQASKHFTNWDIPHGIHMASDPGYSPESPVQICSIDTINSREIYPHCKSDTTLLLIDECFSPDTEILTESGFIRFDELKDEKVAQVKSDNQLVSFVTPIRKIVKTKSSKMVRVKSSKTFDAHLTENHEMLVKHKTRGWIKERVKDVTNTRKIPVSGFGSGVERHLSSLEKLAIAYQADGSIGYDHVGNELNVHFQFSKNRKIKAFLELMKEGEYNFKELKPRSKYGNVKERRRFTVFLPFKISKDVSLYFSLEKLSKEKASEIIEYMNIWDGHIASKNTYLYTNTCKKSVDFYHAVCCLAGYKGTISVINDKRKASYKTIYRLFITKKNLVSSQGFNTTASDYDGPVYCVTVPHGNIITRLNGKTIIAGNCQDCASPTYQKLFNQYPHANVCGFTATPYRDNSIWEEYVCPIEPWQLRDQGYLVPERTFIPFKIDTSNVKTVAGEFVNDQLAEVCSESYVMGNIIKSWKEYAQGRRTVLFAVNIEHSKLMCDSFNAAGIKTIHCDASTPQHERDEAIQKLINKEISILCNVNIFSTGVDIPEIECISFCRPTHSLIYWIQAVGRGLRPAPGKKNCIILDHAANTLRHGGPYLPRIVSLESTGSGKIREEGDIEIRTCDNCFYIYQGDHCPICGFENEKKHHKIKVKDGKLVEYTMSEKELERAKIKSFKADFIKMRVVTERRNFKPNWKYFQLLKKYGKDFCREHYRLVDFPTFLLK
jgi:DNA repair protein RadD